MEHRNPFKNIIVIFTYRKDVFKMLNTAIDSILYERASFVRDIEYMRNNVIDSEVQDAILAYETANNELTVETTDDEINTAIKQAAKDDSTEQEEIERIVRSDKDLTLDQIIGITDDAMNIDDDFE